MNYEVKKLKHGWGLCRGWVIIWRYAKRADAVRACAVANMEVPNMDVLK